MPRPMPTITSPFGAGHPFLPGAMLARKEIQVAFRALERLTNIRLVEARTT